MKFPVGIGVAAVFFTVVGSGYAQEPPSQPRTPQQRPAAEATETNPLPEAPAEQFSACAGITDRAEREACVQRETAKGNPALKRKTPAGDVPIKNTE